MENAKMLLSSTDKSITDIAFSCGFSSQGYFSERFTDVVGISPTKYRLEARLNK
jgi:AraC-like DNA-binding protein